MPSRPAIGAEMRMCPHNLTNQLFLQPHSLAKESKNTLSSPCIHHQLAYDINSRPARQIRIAHHHRRSISSMPIKIAHAIYPRRNRILTQALHNDCKHCVEEP